jgi:hypothetical protein
VLASLIRIDRLREGDVGRIVARDDRARALQGDRRLQRRQRIVAFTVLRRPAIVDGFARIASKAIAGIERRAASLDRRRWFSAQRRLTRPASHPG